ncbi:hypothetical protein C1645_731818 [Glomus cerebriforme]|uniref:Uncharacterized protein n=1 Tax=Glomus cerebriforme TaxID=658196 RepID=A0A397TJ69_9GLOM|nr:hypothetical protein C1645_731818 [Glomus cerebriforme]
MDFLNANNIGLYAFCGDDIFFLNFNKSFAMYPPPPLSAISTAMNIAADSFPSPMHASPNSSPGNLAFSEWNNKCVKYESFLKLQFLKMMNLLKIKLKLKILKVHHP